MVWWPMPSIRSANTAENENKGEMMKKRRLMMILAVLALSGLMASPALADQATLDDNGWGCGAEVGLPAGHCISPGTWANFANIVEKGLTFQLLVFDADGAFVTAEIATFVASADDRACPHDSNVNNTDGTCWPFVPGLYVCHHQSD